MDVVGPGDLARSLAAAEREASVVVVVVTGAAVVDATGTPMELFGVDGGCVTVVGEVVELLVLGKIVGLADGPRLADEQAATISVVSSTSPAFVAMVPWWRGPPRVTSTSGHFCRE